MAYLSFTLPNVRTPGPKRPYLYGAFLFVSFVFYALACLGGISAFSWLLRQPAGMWDDSKSWMRHLLFSTASASTSFVLACFMLLVQVHVAKAGRLYDEMYHTYYSMMKEAEAWDWELKGVKNESGHYTIDCLHGSLFARIIVPSRLVYEGYSQDERVTFGSVTFSMPEVYPDQRGVGRMTFGGIVRLSFPGNEPPPLQDSYDVHISPRYGLGL